MAKIIKLRPARKDKPRRKRADEWRALNRSHKVKDGRQLILAIRDPRRPGERLIGQGYWHAKVGGWWWANTGPDLPGCDAINDVYDMTGASWCPMPVMPIMPMAKAA
jgi:hypothetical protein